MEITEFLEKLRFKRIKPWEIKGEKYICAIDTITGSTLLFKKESSFPEILEKIIESRKLFEETQNAEC